MSSCARWSASGPRPPPSATGAMCTRLCGGFRNCAHPPHPSGFGEGEHCPHPRPHAPSLDSTNVELDLGRPTTLSPYHALFSPLPAATRRRVAGSWASQHVRIAKQHVGNVPAPPPPRRGSSGAQREERGAEESSTCRDASHPGPPWPRQCPSRSATCRDDLRTTRARSSCWVSSLHTTAAVSRFAAASFARPPSCSAPTPCGPCDRRYSPLPTARTTGRGNGGWCARPAMRSPTSPPCPTRQQRRRCGTRVLCVPPLGLWLAPRCGVTPVTTLRCVGQDVVVDYDGAHDFNNMGMLARRPALVQVRARPQPCPQLGGGATSGLTLQRRAGHVPGVPGNEWLPEVVREGAEAVARAAADAERAAGGVDHPCACTAPAPGHAPVVTTASLCSGPPLTT